MRRVVWLAALLSVACGDDDGDSGAPSSTKLSDLSKQQLDAVCSDVDAHYLRFEKAFVSVDCTNKARRDQNTCEAMRSQCIKTTNPEGSLIGEVEFSCKGSSTSITTQCPQITAGELNTCMDAILDGVEGLAAKYTCTADQNALTLPPTPASCVALGDRCPMFAEFSLSGS
ncbi:MAG TPA: hypothetical protein VI299_00140 [Polyangiales bacterium]